MKQFRNSFWICKITKKISHTTTKSQKNAKFNILEGFFRKKTYRTNIKRGSRNQ